MVGGEGAAGVVSLIFQPTCIGKLVATSLDPTPGHRNLLEQDTMPLIHESYDSLPCTFNLGTSANSNTPMRV